MELCRVCRKSETEMCQLFDSNSNGEIINMINFCTGILFTKTNVLSSKICVLCLEELQTANKFKLKCIKSEEMYEDIIILTIKDEPNDEKLLYNEVNINKGDKDFACYNNKSFLNNNAEDVDVADDDVHNTYEDVLKDDVEKGFDYKLDIKVENTVFMNTNIRKTKKVRLKNKDQNSVCNEESVKTKIPVKVTRKRGPYKKSAKQPRRLTKLKFRKLFCEGCNMKFNSKQESDNHKKEFHNEPQLWICEICGKSFAHRSSQHSHMRIHYPPQHACDHCDYKTANKHDLNKHLRIHSGNKSYICPICAAAYRTSSNLHAHVRLTHERLRKHACTLCARTFYDRSKLNRHIDSHNDVKRYSCEVCHSCFTRRCYWKKHLQKQHDIVIPSCRPGRPRAGVVPSEKEVINHDGD